MNDAYFKEVTDETNRLETAKEEGELEERQIIIRKLVESGMPLEQIEETLGLDPREYL